MGRLEGFRGEVEHISFGVNYLRGAYVFVRIEVTASSGTL